MRKLFFSFISTLLLITMLSATIVSADTPTIDEVTGTIISQTTEYFEDGSSVITIITEYNSVMACATTATKTASKEYIALNKDGIELWRFTVHGRFFIIYGDSASCTQSTYSIDITSDAWENQSASASKSMNQALGTATFTRKLLGITVETKTCNVTLTCDSNGNFS